MLFKQQFIQITIEHVAIHVCLCYCQCCANILSTDEQDENEVIRVIICYTNTITYQNVNTPKRVTATVIHSKLKSNRYRLLICTTTDTT